MPARQLCEAVSARTGIPVRRTRQVCRVLREAGLIPPGAMPPMQPLHVARIIIALASELVKDVSDDVRQAEALPRVGESNAPRIAGAMLTSLVEALAGRRNVNGIDLTEGFVEVHQAWAEVTVRCRGDDGQPISYTYGEPDDLPADTFASRMLGVPFATIRRLAADLIR